MSARDILPRKQRRSRFRGEDLDLIGHVVLFADQCRQLALNYKLVPEFSSRLRAAPKPGKCHARDGFVMSVARRLRPTPDGLRRTACVQFAEKADETAVFELAEVTVRGKEQIIKLSAV